MHHSSFTGTKRDGKLAIFRREPPERGHRIQGGMNNHDFRPISGFISQMMQDRAMEGEEETAPSSQAFEWYQFQ